MSDIAGLGGADCLRRGTDGRGHTSSRQVSGQYSLILSKRYHCRSADSPEGVTTGGRSVAEGDQSSLSILNFTSSLSLNSFRVTFPRLVVVKMKWCCFLIWGILRKWSPRNSTQSYIGTSTVPSSSPTSSAMLGAAELVMAFARSFRQPMILRRSFCFARPKHQSGENFVCPARRKEMVILSWRPVSILHIMYCIR